MTGGRTIKITDDKGHIFRSICQATSALEGDRLEPNKRLKAASKGGARMLQDGKKEKGKLANGSTSKEQGEYLNFSLFSEKIQTISASCKGPLLIFHA